MRQKANCLIGQSGGPTAVINASVLGLLKAAQKTEMIDDIYGMKFGIQGVLEEKIFDLGEEDQEELKLLRHTPSSILGSCRYRLKHFTEDEEDYLKIFKVLDKYNIRYLFYIGGNDSMDTVNKLDSYAREKNIDIKFIGIPKTIDNDLVETDHCPGYGSSARYIATSVMEVARDSHVYDRKNVHIIEVMGRNAGWLAGSSVLARKDMFSAPDFIYLPEISFDMDSFLADVEGKLKEKKSVNVVVAEGIKDSNGNYIFADQSTEHDIFGHKQMGGVSALLAHKVKKSICERVKYIEFNVLQRAALHFASSRDIEEAYLCGKKGGEYALRGESGIMVALERISNSPYKSRTKKVPVNKIANKEKIVPTEWINEKGNDVKEDFVNYVSPLIKGKPEIAYNEEGLPRYAFLDRETI